MRWWHVLAAGDIPAAAAARHETRQQVRAAAEGIVGALVTVYRQRRRVGIFLGPWLLVVAVSVPLLWYQIEAGYREARVARSADILRVAEDLIKRVLDRLGRDILFLGALTAGLPEQELRPEGIGGRLFMSFAASSPDYDQVRWIDERGWERLRADRRDTAISLVPRDQLQDKSARGYFQDANALPMRGIYYSAFDLNVEHEMLEIPFRPTLRVATPLQGAGERRGIVIINYAAQALLSRIRHIAGTGSDISLLVANHDGYWIVGPSAGQEWGWQRGQLDANLAHENPRLWAAVWAAPAGEVRQGETFWLFRRLDLGEGLITAREASVIGGPGTHLFLLIRMNAAPGEGGEATAKIILSVLALAIMAMVLVIGLRLAEGLEREARQTRAFQSANAALTDANRHLEEAQRDIARAERLSSLGLMVAGVAHELNTPLGVATLSLSRALDAVATLEGKLASGLRRSDLDTFLASERGDVALALDALHRCAGLVRRFKQVALDRATLARRRMDLAETIHDADPRLRRWDATGGVALVLELDEGLEMDSYPGPLQQVVSNLLGNTLKHAFPQGRHGTVILRARAEGPHSVRIEVEDDGAGIAPDALPRVFEPFFTTARARGGTGLGLHIVHQIATELLGGQIHIASPPPGARSGTVITLILPRIAPEQTPGTAQP
ncbi:sensor histidine kinase [Xanthobacter sediminis]